VAGHRFTGAKGTAIAVAAMAALTASQAPGTVARAAAPAEGTGAHGPTVSGDTPYRTALPPLRVRESRTSAVGGALPESVFAAYRRAESELRRSAPACRLRWQLLAAIGQVESGQARGGRVTSDGTTRAPILGPRLDGNGFAAIRDSDGGIYDGDSVYDRAVGPMQFIPSTWAAWGVDGNGDGRADPHNVYDAALAAGRYLCAGGRDLSDPGDLDQAILGYNHSEAYLRTVKAWYGYFLEGHRVVPDSTADSAARSAPKAHRTTRAPSPAPSRHPARAASPAPATPSPSPTASRPTGAAEEPRQPVIPLPEPGVGLPSAGVLPTAGPLTGGNDENSMGAAPSTILDTGR
jgi:membrane-bound lytic murein transglycosylase B